MDEEMYGDAQIEIERTEEFYQSAKELSEFIDSLNLRPAQNNALVDLIHEHVKDAEAGAFAMGMKIGILYERDNPGEAKVKKKRPNVIRIS